jgi:hypothetical protein
MNIVRITSGLGNQMFQYAFYRALKANWPETKIDVSEFRHRRHHNGYELEQVFDIVPDHASRKECDSLADQSKDLLSEFRRRFLRVQLECTGTLVRESELGACFHPELLTMRNGYFQGFWQTERYFLPVAGPLRTAFTFRQPMDAVNSRIAEEIGSCEAVSIHVRRGDYVKKRRLETIGSVCTPRYYRDAIAQIRARVPQPRFFVFSDDPAWVRKNVKVDDALHVDVNTGPASFRDMQLMSLCKHHIIANSSFSWWGAWLNSNPGRLVLAPDVWLRGASMPDVVPEGWLRVTTA